MLSHGAWGIALVWGLALLVDARLGEMARGHPLVVYGRYVACIEQGFNICSQSASRQFLQGLAAFSLVTVPPVLLVILMAAMLRGSALLLVGFDVVILYFAIGRRSLKEHAMAVRKPLLLGNLPEARAATARIVSRDTADLSEGELVTAVVETGLENSNDAVCASLFWYAIGGSAGVVLHRLSNTLDAMWGYRNERFNYFGRCAARVDDVLGFIPAQLLSLSHALLAPRRSAAFRAWQHQGWGWKSINAGSVMVSGAMALGVKLGGAARYHGQWSPRPVLGEGREPHAGDIEACFSLQNKVLLLWFGTVILIALVAS